VIDATVIKESWEDPERFAAIFDRYFTEIHRHLARRVGGKVASDVAAEVFLAAFAQRKRYDVARGCARPWLYGIATNMAAAHWRDERRLYRALTRAPRTGRHVKRAGIRPLSPCAGSGSPPAARTVP
jgi:DNA-directed RNA polymerase specialized sigma24 family protein